MYILFLLFLLLLPMPAWGVAAIVQNNNCYEATDDTSFTCAFTSNVTANNLLIVTVGAYEDSVITISASDSRSTSYSQAGTTLRATTDNPNPQLAVFYGIAPSSGANTVTVSFTIAAADKNITIWEISGIDTVSPLDQQAGATNGGATSSSALSGSITTTTSPGSFILKVVQEFFWTTHNHAAGTPTTGWTEYNDNATGSDTAYRIEATTGTFNGGFTLGASTTWACQIVAFEVVAAGLPNRPRLLQFQ